MREQRLLHYESYFGRFLDTLERDYDCRDPLQWVAAGTHAVTQFGGVDPAMRDVGRMLDGSSGEKVPALDGLLPRTRENIFGGIRDLFRGRIFSALTKAINVAGDGAADGADLLTGVHHTDSQRARASASDTHYALAA
jgi:hypothetical protein